MIKDKTEFLICTVENYNEQFNSTNENYIIISLFDEKLILININRFYK